MQQRPSSPAKKRVGTKRGFCTSAKAESTPLWTHISRGQSQGRIRPNDQVCRVPPPQGCSGLVGGVMGVRRIRLAGQDPPPCGSRSRGHQARRQPACCPVMEPSDRKEGGRVPYAPSPAGARASPGNLQAEPCRFVGLPLTHVISLWLITLQPCQLSTCKPRSCNKY